MLNREEMIEDMKQFVKDIEKKHKFKIGEQVRFYHYGYGSYLDGEIIGYQYDCGDLKYIIKYEGFSKENTKEITVLVDECCISAKDTKKVEKVNPVKQENKCENKTEEVNEAHEPMNVKEDVVNHPSHYEGKTSIECMESMIIAFGVEYVYHFCICNVYKYLWRHKNKNGLEDVKKAEYYLNKATDLCVNHKHDYFGAYEIDMIGRLENQLFDAFMFYGIDKRKPKKRKEKLDF